MPKTVKLLNDTYLDSSSIMHNRELLSKKVINSSGSNNNGEWIKFEDGTMIITQQVEGTIDINVSWGNGFYTSRDITFPDYPVSFITTPCVAYGLQTQQNRQCMMTGTGNNNIKDKSHAGGICLCRPSSISVSYMIDIISIGRWK